MNIQTDEALVIAFKNGQNEAFEELVYRYKNSLFQYIYAMAKDEAVAEDLFQEVFVTFFKQRDRFEVSGKFKSWLFLTARNRVFNFFRDQKQPISLDQTDEEGNAFLQETIADPSKQPLDQLTGQETDEQIRRMVAELPPRQREIIYLRAYFSFKEIAELVGRPLGTVLADCHRAIKKMQELLTQYCVVEKKL